MTCSDRSITNIDVPSVGLIGIGRGLTASPSHTTGQTGHGSGGSADDVRVRRHPNRSVVSRRASGEFIPGARAGPTPRRMPSHRSTSGHDSSPPFRPSARAGVPTMPSADFCRAVREDCSALSPDQDTPQISRGKLSYRRCIDAGFIKHSPFVDGGLCGGVPTRPDCTTPHIRFVSLAPHLRSTRPSDPTSR
jgi:hypothetical protein